MSESEKLARILELYRSLSDDEKDLLAGELVRDEDMMRRLIEVITEESEARGLDYQGTDTYVDFLRRVKLEEGEE